jgi:hypothetical protein
MERDTPLVQGGDSQGHVRLLCGHEVTPGSKKTRMRSLTPLEPRPQFRVASGVGLLSGAGDPRRARNKYVQARPTLGSNQAL